MTVLEQARSLGEVGAGVQISANGARVLALDQRGELILFDASPDKFSVLDRRKVSREPTWAHLAVEGDSVFVRGLKSLEVFRWE